MFSGCCLRKPFPSAGAEGSFRRRHGGPASTVQFTLIAAALNLTLKRHASSRTFLILLILLRSVGAQLSKLWAMGLRCGPVDTVHAEKSLRHFASSSLEAKIPNFGHSHPYRESGPLAPLAEELCQTDAFGDPNCF